MKKRILALTMLVAMCLSLTACKGSDYKKAVSYQEAEDYESAISIYEELSDYKDASSRLEECQNIVAYDSATTLLESKDYVSAREAFEALGDYSDASDKVDFCDEMIFAIDEFDSTSEALQEKNTALDAAIDAANEIVLSEDKALNEDLRPEAETAMSSAKAAKVEIPTMAETADEIRNQAAEMAEVDYQDVLDELDGKKTALETSIKQYALVNNPAESYVIECLGTVSGITGISAVTEENDPNGNLGKAGGYTAAVYFSHENVNQSDLSGDTIIEKGTDCGGQIEVYANEDDANKRNDYLASFDGTIFASGSHTVVGTCIVRTSNELTVSQQNELEANIIAALTSIE